MRAAESTHFYKRDGTPCYTLIGANGKERPVTVRDARKLNLVPSVTTIIKCAAAPGLEKWKLQQMLLSSLTLPRQVDELESEWIERIWIDSGETGRKAADRGTQIHAALQGAYEGESYVGYEAHVQGATAVVQEWAGTQSWVAEKPFANPLGFGGKTDLHCPGWLLDFKTKEFAFDHDLTTWPEQHMQLAANREGQGMPNARCAIVYVSATYPGLSRVIEIPEEDLQRGWECFVHLLSFWKAKNKYHSGFQLEEPTTV